MSSATDPKEPTEPAGPRSEPPDRSALGPLQVVGSVLAAALGILCRYTRHGGPQMVAERPYACSLGLEPPLQRPYLLDGRQTAGALLCVRGRHSWALPRMFGLQWTTCFLMRVDSR